MATAKKTYTKKTETPDSNLSTDKKNEEVQIEEKQVVTVEKRKEQRKFDASDLIPCTSIVEGQLIMVGRRTGTMYSWFGSGETIDVEYQDLSAEILSRNSMYIYSPLIIIEDEDVLSAHKSVKEVYEKMYSVKDLNDILKMPIGQMKKVISNLPVGVKDNLKILAATNIQNGSLDSIKKINALDEIFGTQLITESELFR